MVLMPEAYYAATILQQKIYRPCTIPPTDNMYVHQVVMLNNIISQSILRQKAAQKHIKR